MRIKNWERDPEGKDYQWWNKKKYTYIMVEQNKNLNWNVILGNKNLKKIIYENSNKKMSLKFATNYMRSHPLG